MGRWVKRALLAGVAGFVTGCAAPTASYEADVRLSRTAAVGEYQATFIVRRVLPDNTRQVVAMPRLRVKDGSEGEASVQNPEAGRGVTCRILVQGQGRAPSATATVAVREGGRDVWICAQRTVWEPPSPGAPAAATETAGP